MMHTRTHTYRRTHRHSCRFSSSYTQLTCISCSCEPPLFSGEGAVCSSSCWYVLVGGTGGSKLISVMGGPRSDDMMPRQRHTTMSHGQHWSFTGRHTILSWGQHWLFTGRHTILSWGQHWSFTGRHTILSWGQCWSFIGTDNNITWSALVIHRCKHTVMSYGPCLSIICKDTLSCQVVSAGHYHVTWSALVIHRQRHYHAKQSAGSSKWPFILTEFKTDWSFRQPTLLTVSKWTVVTKTGHQWQDLKQTGHSDWPLLWQSVSLTSHSNCQLLWQQWSVRQTTT